MKTVLRAVKNAAYSYRDVEIKVREATCNNERMPTRTLYREVARATYDTNDYPHLFAMIWQRLADVEYPLHVTKALLLIENLLIHGSQRFVTDTRRRKNDINALTQYKHYDEHNNDDAKEARMVAKRVSSLLSNLHVLSEARETNVRLKHSSSEPIQQDEHVHQNELDEEDNDDIEEENVNVDERVRRSYSSDRHMTARTNHPVSSNREARYVSHRQVNDHVDDQLDIVSEEEIDEQHDKRKHRTNTRTTIHQSQEIYEENNVNERYPTRRSDMKRRDPQDMLSHRQPDYAPHTIENNVISETYIQPVRPSNVQSKHIVEQLDLLSLDNSQVESPVHSTYVLTDRLVLSPSAHTYSQPKRVLTDTASQNRKAQLLAELAELEQQHDATSLHDEVSDVEVQPQSTRSLNRSKLATDPLWSSSLVSLSPIASSNHPISSVAGGTSMAELRRARPFPSSAASSQLVEDFAHRDNGRETQMGQRRTQNADDIFFG